MTRHAEDENDGRENSERGPTDRREAPRSLFDRLHDALGPVLFGVVFDALDVATFGPVGVLVGPLVGGVAGWWMSTYYGYRGALRWGVVAACAAYMALPWTEPLPLATLVAAVARYRK